MTYNLGWREYIFACAATPTMRGNSHEVVVETSDKEGEREEGVLTLSCGRCLRSNDLQLKACNYNLMIYSV